MARVVQVFSDQSQPSWVQPNPPLVTNFWIPSTLQRNDATILQPEPPDYDCSGETPPSCPGPFRQRLPVQLNETNGRLALRFDTPTNQDRYFDDYLNRIFGSHCHAEDTTTVELQRNHAPGPQVPWPGWQRFIRPHSFSRFTVVERFQHPGDDNEQGVLAYTVTFRNVCRTWHGVCASGTA